MEQQEARFERALAVFSPTDQARARAALVFAQHAHKGQLRDGLSHIPYIIHPIRVACTLIDELGERNADAFIAAILHDVVEDCGVALDGLERLFGRKVRRYVAALTWPKVAREEKWLLARAMLRQPRIIRLIKSSDIIDNSRATWEVDDRAKLLRWIYGYRRWGRMIVRSVGAPATIMLDAALAKTTTIHFGHDPEPPFPPNAGKSLMITFPVSRLTSHVSRLTRYPVRTHVITKQDQLIEVIKKYVVPHLHPDDTLVISERIVAITQGRAFPIAEIKPSRWAHLLVRFVHKSPYGIGLGSPWTMELAIREAGLPRILLAALLAALTKPFGIRGVFYKIVGNNINAIDGPCDYTLPPFNQYAKLGPKDPNLAAANLARRIGVDVAIIDANDLGVNVLGVSEGVNRRFVAAAFHDNPLGQSREQTPMAIVRARDR
ncbi:MAG: HD domain-containing protein [Candidatus Uhrbacteria bacterium]